MRLYQVRAIYPNLGDCVGRPEHGATWDIVFHDDAKGLLRYSPHIYFTYAKAVEVADALEKEGKTPPDWAIAYTT